MPELTYRAAVAAGLAQEMARDPSVVFLGEDVAAAGGVFKTTSGLLDEFGPKRVLDTPISEQAILGMAMGAAIFHSTGFYKDGTHFDRPGRVTAALMRNTVGAPWLATHTHVSLKPGTPSPSYANRPEAI